MIYGYAAAALVFLLAIAGAGWKGYSLGGDAVRVDWDRANVEAAATVEADRKAQTDKARKAASRYQAALATQTATHRGIVSAYEKAMADHPIPADCALPAGVRELINSALAGTGAAGASLPAAGQPVAGPEQRPD